MVVVVLCTKVLSRRYEKVIVFEDDVRFRPFFGERFRHVMHEVASIQLNWDLLYVSSHTSSSVCVMYLICHYTAR